MDNRPIGVFDSGLGGLTTVKRIMEVLRDENIIYFGDTGRVPYGSRSRETIIRYTRDDIDFLLKHDIKLIIAACGTASSVALEALAPEYGVPMIGVVEPACRAAARATKNKRVGVIGTASTVKSGKYEAFLHAFDPDITVFATAAPLFVPLVENGYLEGAVAESVAKDYLLPIKAEGVDTLILGCTHYPLLSAVISSIMGDEVTLINAGAETALYAREVLEKSDSLANTGGNYEFYVSDSVEGFSAAASLFLGREISDVRQIEI